MIEIPKTLTQKQLFAFVSGYTGIDTGWIEEVEIRDNLLHISLHEEFGEFEDFRSDFMVDYSLRDHWMTFEFPLGGWDMAGLHVGDECSYFNNGKELYESTMVRCGTTNDRIFPGDMQP